MELVIGILGGLVGGLYVGMFRYIRLTLKLEDQLRGLKYENRELAGRLDDIQAPTLRGRNPWPAGR
jgi:hypothetical protein